MRLEPPAKRAGTPQRPRVSSSKSTRYLVQLAVQVALAFRCGCAGTFLARAVAARIEAHRARQRPGEPPPSFGRVGRHEDLLSFLQGMKSQ
eukprot:6214819-Pleurochrysis_carterae.AAC.3